MSTVEYHSCAFCYCSLRAAASWLPTQGPPLSINQVICQKIIKKSLMVWPGGLT